jgi:hypothetical protein
VSQTENKIKFALWMTPTTQRLVKDTLARDNCKSQSEFIGKAIRFYAGYVGARDSSEFLSHALSHTLRGMMDDFENRVARLLFKLAVEQAMMKRVLASGMEIGADYLKQLRAECVEEVKRTNGGLSLEQTVRSAE